MTPGILGSETKECLPLSLVGLSQASLPFPPRQSSGWHVDRKAGIGVLILVPPQTEATPPAASEADVGPALGKGIDVGAVTHFPRLGKPVQDR